MELAHPTAPASANAHVARCNLECNIVLSPREHRWSVPWETGRPIFHCDGIGVKIWTAVHSRCPLATFPSMIEPSALDGRIAPPPKTVGTRRFTVPKDKLLI